DYGLSDVSTVRLNDFSLRYMTPIVNQQMITIKQAKEIPQVKLNQLQQTQFMQLPDNNINSKTQLWLSQQLQQGSNNKQILDSLLKRFNEQEYYYTLKPPKLGNNQIDDFLFTNMKGFCVHYASSYIYVARSLGIPARMVTGYFGGELNEQNNYMTVRQYDAHAWAEIWYNGKWLRVDPTAYIASERVDIEVSPTPSDKQLNLSSLLSLDIFGLAVNKLNTVWGTWFVGFDSKKQLDFFQQLSQKYKWANSFYIIFLLLFTAVIVIVLFIFKPWKRSSFSKEDKYYLKLQKHYKRVGINKVSGETVTDYCHKVALSNSNAATNLNQFASIYNRIKYQNNLSQQQRHIALQELVTVLKNIYKNK
ncbi:MAG: transglutaminase-like domain-containing protein, partial [Psychromonas sp.]